MSDYKFRIKTEDIKLLTEAKGYGIVSDKITIDGEKVGFMYKDTKEDDDDSGWRFLSGTESEEYVSDPSNQMFFDLNTIANYDPAIIPYLSRKKGTELERIEGSDEFTELT
ncbi:MAG: DUF2185 domain-containing protein [Bacteroidales bacterium]|nr:DUF2185 domain-containing protein [Bacteroidales bacterium]